MYDILELNKKLVAELREISKELNIRRIESFKKQDLIYKILDTQAVQEAEKKERKYAPKEQIKEDKGIINLLRKKPQVVESPNEQLDEDQRSKRPRRERVEHTVKREKIQAGRKKTKQDESGVQSRQEQIKAIIKGFNREKNPDQPVSYTHL